MKHILCFGDSNTYGYKPEDGSRYDDSIRWTGLLKKKGASEDFEIIEEGLVGRTTVFEDSFRPGRKGIDYIVPLIESHEPVDLVTIMLGTNDCKTIYNASPQVIGLGLERMVKQILQRNADTKLLLVSPIHLGEEVWKEEYDPEFNLNSIEVSKGLKDVYKKIADKYGCEFLAASDYAKPSKEDQEHLSVEGHKALAEAIYNKINII